MTANWHSLKSLWLIASITWPATREVDSLLRSLPRIHRVELITTNSDCNRLFDSPSENLRIMILSQPELYIQDALPHSLCDTLIAPVSADSDDAVDGKTEI